MISCLSTTTLGGTLEQKLQAIGSAGFDAVELFAEELEGYDGTQTDLKARIDDTGLRLANYFPLRDFEGMPGPRRRQAFERAERFLERAAGLGAQMIMVCSNTDPESLSDIEAIAADLDQLGSLGEAHGLKVAYEALAWGRHQYDYRRALDLVLDVDHANVGLVLDTFHIFARKLETASVGDIPPEKIFLVQISDSTMMDLDYLDWSRHHRVLPGQGDFAFDAFTTALKGTGYDGVVSLECFSDSLRTPPPDRVAGEALDALSGLWDTPAAPSNGETR